MEARAATTAIEVEDVYRLRYAVYVGEERYFDGHPAARDGMIFDRFDGFPGTTNLIAYHDDEPVGTLRVSIDTGAGLPPEDVFDFTRHRAQVRDDLAGHWEPVFVSASMLAIARRWRRHAGVLQRLFEVAADVALKGGATHIIATVNARTLEMYMRLGFQAIGSPQWVEGIGENIVPVACPFERFRARVLALRRREAVT